ncbi:MAG: hypothetical protein FJ138_15970 [Deltaproteobacteria bacterium]|nr:hypothetical protein [Deltaproteobacteria bacterium]
MKDLSRRTPAPGAEPRVLCVPLRESPSALDALRAQGRVVYLEHAVLEAEGGPLWWCYLELAALGSPTLASPPPAPPPPAPPPHFSNEAHEARRQEICRDAHERARRRFEAEDPAPTDLALRERLGRLRLWRSDVARLERKSRFIVLTNEQLVQIATLNPSTLAQLRAVRGVGDKRLRLYGEAILGLMVGPYRSPRPPYDPLREEEP